MSRVADARAAPNPLNSTERWWSMKKSDYCLVSQSLSSTCAQARSRKSGAGGRCGRRSVQVESKLPPIITCNYNHCHRLRRRKHALTADGSEGKPSVMPPSSPPGSASKPGLLAFHRSQESQLVHPERIRETVKYATIYQTWCSMSYQPLLLLDVFGG